MISRSLSTLNILYLSNMMAEKGVWVLLDSCAILKDHNIEFHCDFVGGWKDISENDFNCRVSELELQHYVCAHGPKYGEEKNFFWQKADIFVFPTFYHNECFPLVLLEAMMNGLPCISTNEAGIPEIIDDGKTGFVVDKKNPNAIVEKIEYFANNRHCLQEFGEAGKAKFQNQYTLEAFEKRFVQCLKNLL